MFDIGFQADFNPEVAWLNPKGKKMKESSRIKFTMTPDGGANTFTAQLELKVMMIDCWCAWMHVFAELQGEGLWHIHMQYQE